MTANNNKNTKDENGCYNITDFQLYLFNEGTNFQSYNMLGSHYITVDTDEGKKKGWRFAVWAPRAKSVSLVGDFNGWNTKERQLRKIGTTGVWCGFYEDIEEGMLYKYAIEGNNGQTVLKTDPYSFMNEVRPQTASITHKLDTYKWTDKKWLAKRKKTSPYESPMNIYEIHAGSWKTHEDGSLLTYRELADELVPYMSDMGYTHIEFMPLTEYPFDGSWGYQVTGFFAATSRYGTPEDLKYLVDKCHSMDIAVIMDWVPAHFPRDAHGLAKFDGEVTYEYADPRIGEHKEWGTLVFDYTKTEVISFLTSSAYFWVDEYHFDGLRVDAVSSMLYRDYDRRDGEWIANRYGGNENLEAVEFLRSLNKIMFSQFPNILMIAEESTAWSMVTAPAHEGGLGFNYKWNMGWMNDTLKYMAMDPYFRKPNHNLLTFLMCYAYSENYILPLSHDEVVHGKASLIGKMYGEYEQKFASLRALFGYYMSVPGKKLLFMGGEFAQFIEWRYYEGLEWNLLDFDAHKKFKQYVKELNHFYLENKSFWEIEKDWSGFEWINENDAENSVLSYMRCGKKKGDNVICVANFTPVERTKYIIGVPSAGEYEVVFNSDAQKYGGSTRIVKKKYKSVKKKADGRDYSISINLPPMAVLYLKKQTEKQTENKTETHVKKNVKKAAAEKKKVNK